MPHPKIKSENYNNFGGVNSKISPYTNGPHEFLDLTNLDFQTPGSLSSRWGTTQYFETLGVGRITGLYDFQKASGYSSVVFSYTGALFAADNNTWSGVSLSNINATLVSLLTTAGCTLGAAFGVSASTYYINSQQIRGNLFDFVTYNNHAYLADGQNFFKFDGITTTRYSLPPVLGSSQGVFATIGLSPEARYFGGTVISFALAFVSDLGVIGPPQYIGYADLSAVNGATEAYVINPVYVPDGYGITAINIYTNYGDTALPNGPFYFWEQRAATVVGGVQNVFLGHKGGSAGNFPILGTSLANTNVYWSQGSTTVGSTSTFFGNAIAPRFMEVFSNQLFFAGASTLPSTVFFSEIGQPEVIQPDYSFEVRSNDGDSITALRAYSTKLMIFKENSFYALSGDNPDNFFVSEVSTEYGCLSNRAVAVFNNNLAFWDRKGLMLYDGANVECLSDRIQPIVDRVNYSAAKNNISIVHDKSRNELLIGVPLDGATFMNTTLVYDYLVPGGAWTKYEGYNPAVFAIVQGRLSKKTVMYGGYSGMISNFGASLIGDNGSGFTCLWQTRFVSNGQSVEQQWRRFWMNVDPVPSATIPITINLLQDYGQSYIQTHTMYANPFQSRIDFGIPAKSLSVLGSFNSATMALKIHGYALGYRYQRDV